MAIRSAKISLDMTQDLQYVPSELFSNLMSHLCCMVTTFLTDGFTILLQSFSPGLYYQSSNFTIKALV